MGNWSIVGQVFQRRFSTLRSSIPSSRSSWRRSLCSTARGNSSICSTASCDLHEEALVLFNRMRENSVSGNEYTYGTLVMPCTNLSALHQGKWFHGCLIKSGIELSSCLVTSLLDMYVKCGDISNARRMFDEHSHVDLVMWTAMIVGYTHNGNANEALSLFQKMKGIGIKPNCVTIASILSCCGLIGNLELGRSVHGLSIKVGLWDTDVANALVHMYAKCYQNRDAKYVFERESEKDIVAWNSMISGFSQNGSIHEALFLFHRMNSESVMPNGEFRNFSNTSFPIRRSFSSAARVLLIGPGPGKKVVLLGPGANKTTETDGENWMELVTKAFSHRLYVALKSRCDKNLIFAVKAMKLMTSLHELRRKLMQLSTGEEEQSKSYNSDTASRGLDRIIGAVLVGAVIMCLKFLLKLAYSQYKNSQAQADLLTMLLSHRGEVTAVIESFKQEMKADFVNFQKSHEEEMERRFKEVWNSHEEDMKAVKKMHEDAYEELRKKFEELRNELDKK